MSSEQYIVKAAPLKNNVAFVTRTGDDAGPEARSTGGQVPGFGTPGEAVTLEQPCTLKGLSGGLGAGVLGYAFGFLPAMLRHRSLREIHVWNAEGMASAKAFAVMSGVYTAVQCLCERIRQRDDGINRIIAGGASGVAIAWRSGFVGALQSGVFLAVINWVFDLGNGSVGQAKAAGLGCSSGSCSVSVGRVVSCSYDRNAGSPATAGGRGGRPLHLHLGGQWRPGSLDPKQILNTPPIMWLGPIVNQAYFSPPALSVNV